MAKAKNNILLNRRLTRQDYDKIIAVISGAKFTIEKKNYITLSIDYDGVNFALSTCLPAGTTATAQAILEDVSYLTLRICDAIKKYTIKKQKKENLKKLKSISRTKRVY